MMQRRSFVHLNWKFKTYMPIETIVSSTAISMQTCSHVRYAKALDSKNNDRLKEGEELKKGISTLVMWYLPIIPRLKHFFANSRDAELASWHDDKLRKDRMLWHPADAMQWRKIDMIYPTFGGDPKNLRFGLTTDAINPYGDWNSKHNTWPLLLCMCWYFVTSRIKSAMHWYRCSFHPRVFQDIISTGEREYTIYRFRLSKDTHTGVGGYGREDFLRSRIYVSKKRSHRCYTSSYWFWLAYTSR